jgi:DNA-binding MarR family transcriptional regulator
MDRRLHQYLTELFQLVHYRLMEQYKEILKRYNMPFTYLVILVQIEKEPGITVSGLARLSGLVKSYISTMIEELHLRGMVYKRPDQNDQRLTRIFLTVSAVDLLNDVKDYMEEQFTRLLDNVTDAQIESMIAGLNVIHDVLKKRKDL